MFLFEEDFALFPVWILFRCGGESALFRTPEALLKIHLDLIFFDRGSINRYEVDQGFGRLLLRRVLSVGELSFQVL